MNPIKFIDKIKEMYNDQDPRYASIPDAFDPDLEQSEFLRPGETLEDWKPNPFLKPHADGGRIGLFGGGFLKLLYKGKSGLQHGAHYNRLMKQYKSQGMDLLKAGDKAMAEASEIVNQKKLKIVKDKMSEVNIQSDDYVDLIDEHIRIVEPDFYKDIKRWDQTRPDLADKQRALFFPDWAEARYGADYEGVLQRQQARALRENIDPNFKEPLSPADQMVSDIDDMNKANLDELLEGRKKNAYGGRAGYNDGQLVTPSVDGSRPGYQGKNFIDKDTFIDEYKNFQKLKNNLGTDEEFAKYLNKNYKTRGADRKGYSGKFTTKVVQLNRTHYKIKTPLSSIPPSVQKQLTEVTKYLEEIIPKLNASEKYVTKKQVSSMVEKKFNIKPKYTMVGGKKYKINKFDPDNYSIMNKLDSVDQKIEKTLKNMRIEDKPLNNFWYKALTERTGLDRRTIWNRIDDSPTYKVIKDQGALSLKNKFNKVEYHSYLKDYSFSDQLTQALEMEKGMPRYTGMGKEKYYSHSPKFKVFEFAKRNFHSNKGNGAVKFFNKKGKRIIWDYGLELPYKDVYFTYNGKKYSASDKIKNTNNLTNIEILKKDFKEVYKNQTAINNLRRQEVDNPFGKGKITLGELVKRNQVDAYQWGKGGSTFDILHGSKGVGGEPFTNLSFNTKDINQLEMGIVRDKTLSQTQKNNLVKSLYKLTGSGDPEAIKKRQVALTGDIKSGKITSYEDMKNKFLKQAGFKIDKCLSSGGRVKLQGGGGVNTCIRGVIEAEQKAAQRGSKEALKKFSKFGKLARTGAWILGPIDIPIELGFALPHMLAGDKEAAKRATTFGLFGYGKDKLDEIKAGSPEAYKYAKHMKDNDDYIDAYFSAEDAKLNLDKLKDLPEHVQQEKKFIYNDQKLKAEEKMDSIMKGYEGYFDEDRIGQKKFDVWGEAKGKSAFQDYLIKDVTEKTDKGLDMKEYGGHGMNIALGLPWNFGMKEGIAPFKGGQPITNLKQHIAQRGQPYWKQLEHAAYEAGRPELFDRYFATADVREPEDAYSDLPIKYASQLGKLEKEEMLRGLKAKGLHGTVGFKKMLEAQGIDPQEVWDVGKKDWEFDILGKRHIGRADGGRAGYMGGGIAGIRKPNAIPPERQGLRSIMINGKKS